MGNRGAVRESVTTPGVSVRNNVQSNNTCRQWVKFVSKCGPMAERGYFVTPVGSRRTAVRSRRVTPTYDGMDHEQSSVEDRQKLDFVRRGACRFQTNVLVFIFRLPLLRINQIDHN